MINIGKKILKILKIYQIYSLIVCNHYLNLNLKLK